MKIVTAIYTCSCGYKTNWATLAIYHKIITWIQNDGHEYSMEQKIYEAGE